VRAGDDGALSRSLSRRAPPVPSAGLCEDVFALLAEPAAAEMARHPRRSFLREEVSLHRRAMRTLCALRVPPPPPAPGVAAPPLLEPPRVAPEEPTPPPFDPPTGEDKVPPPRPRQLACHL
jgi:hypothetical protein